MRYLETFQLFESATRQSVTDEIVYALENTVEGKDLLALAARGQGNDLYKPRRTGRVEINNLRGKTYITQLPNGEWYHAVEATGRTYGEGVYNSLNDCIRGVWVDFITNSTSIRPQGMPLKIYKGFVDQEINNLIGKNLSIQEIRNHFSKEAYFGGKQPMDGYSPIFSSPRWKQILDFIGLEKIIEPYAITLALKSFPKSIWGYVDNKKNSPLLQLAAVVLKTSGSRGFREASLYDLHFRSVPLSITFITSPQKMSVDNITDHVYIRVGDTIEKSKEVETIAAKEFLRLKSSVGSSYIDEELPERKQMQMYGILKEFVKFAMDLFAKGMEGEDEIEINDTAFFKMVAKEMKDLQITPEELYSIRKNVPSLWNIYKNLAGNDPISLETLADLGEVGF
jgi:hypothetical protein